MRSPRWMYTLLTLGSLLIGLVVVIRGASAFVVPGDSDLHNYFFKSADQILNGHPASIYTVRGDAPLPDPNDDPPMIDFMVAPVLAAARLFSSDFRVQVALVCIPFLVAVPLLGALVLRALRTAAPRASDAHRQVVFALISFSPLLWIAFSPWGHLEIPLMLCALVATVLVLQAGHDNIAGLLAAVTLLTSLTALFPLLALLALLLACGEVRRAGRVVLVSAVVLIVAMSPFLLVDRHDTLYSLITWRPSTAIGRNSIWSLVNFGGTGIGSILRRLDTPCMVLFALGTGWFAARRLGVRPNTPDAWAVVAVGALALPMFVKANWPYYYAAAFVLLIVWESASDALRSRDRVVPWLAVTYLAVTATLAQYVGMPSIAYGDRVITGITELVAMGLTVITVAHLLALRSAPTPMGLAEGRLYPEKR